MDILKCTITNSIERSNAIIILAIKTTEHFVYKVIKMREDQELPFIVVVQME